MKICTVVGARPQFIKAASVSNEIKKTNGIEEIMIHTGQHFDDNMSKIFFQEMGIPKPDYNLGIGGLSHGAMLGRQIEAIETILLDENPSWVLVYGDTNSTLAAALAASKIKVKIAHVEAGLRSYNREMPEESNRVLTDHLSDLLFIPNKSSIDNLIKEGIEINKIKHVGDVMFDSCLFYEKLAMSKSKVLDKVKIKPNEYILATIHRQENTDNFLNLSNIFKAFEKSEKTIVLPLHPRTKNKIKKYKIELSPIIKIIDPVGYLDMLMLTKYANKIVTDSGGLQKEAYFLKKACVILRNETEWVEIINDNLVGAKTGEIIKLLNAKNEGVSTKNFFGDGNSSKLIVEELIS
jgi:UDP-GlcNAc3NAcA epimerase